MAVFILAIHVFLICQSYQRKQCYNVHTIVKNWTGKGGEKIHPQFSPKKKHQRQLEDQVPIGYSPVPNKEVNKLEHVN